MRRVRILVVDDHQMLREALVGMLELSGFEVVGAVADGADATSLATELVPDVILMDLSMPDLSGIDAMKVIHQTKPDLPVVILTAHADPGVEREAREAGASGFLAKGIGLDDLVIVLHEAAETQDERVRDERV